MKPSAADLAEMAAAVGGTLIAARQWLEAGFSPGDAAAYVRAGCFDVDRTLELRETPSRQTAELPWTHPTSDRPGPRWRRSAVEEGSLRQQVG